MIELDELSMKAFIHNTEQFGPTPLVFKLLKLSEEYGEFYGAVVRHYEQRDGRDWLEEIVKELGDMVNVIMTILQPLGVSFEELIEAHTEDFLSRTWDVDPGQKLDLNSQPKVS